MQKMQMTRRTAGSPARTGLGLLLYMALPVLLALVLGLMTGCNSDSPTAPDPGDGGGNGTENGENGDNGDNGDNGGGTSNVTFSGPGAADLATTSFEVDASFIDAAGNYVWIDHDAAKAAGDVKILAFPNPVDPSTVTSISLFCEGTIPKAWLKIGLSGVPGVSIDGSKVTVTDVAVSDAIMGREDVVINGTFDAPTVTLLIPEAPANVSVTPADENLTVTWSEGVDVESYTVYVSRSGTLTPDNWENQSGGARYENATSPFTFPDALPAGATHYVLVTATNIADQNPASTLASGTPTGSAADAGSLTFSGAGASQLASSEFAPNIAGPDIGDAGETQFFWIDTENTEGRLLVYVDPNDVTRTLSIRFASGDKSWDVTEFLDGVSNVTRSGSQVTFNGTVLEQETGGSDDLVLNGTVNATAVFGASMTGSFTFSGTGVSTLPSNTFTPAEYRFEKGNLVLVDANEVQIEISLANQQLATSAFIVRYSFMTVFFGQGNPITGFSMTGTRFTADGINGDEAFGNTELVIDGEVGF